VIGGGVGKQMKKISIRGYCDASKFKREENNLIIILFF